MPSTITPIAPFYSEHSSAPPPCAAILTDQQELWGMSTRSSGLLADEALTASHLDTPHRHPFPQAATMPTREFKLAAAKSPGRAVSLPPPSAKRQTRASSKAVGLSKVPDTVEEEEESSAAGASDAGGSDVESTMSVISEESKIPKPPGEPGRPGRGGYNLESTLGWSAKNYTKLKKYVYDLVSEHLDTSKCASVQSGVLLTLVQDKATTKFPDLENYVRCWPVTDLVMMQLKYTSSRARKQEIEMAAGKSKKNTK